MLTLEEAIAHCREKALSCSSEQQECALEHVQLMDWLKELKCLRKVVDKKYLDGISVLKSAFGEDYDKYFECELRRDLKCLQNLRVTHKSKQLRNMLKDMLNLK